MHEGRGVCLIAYGENARREAGYAVRSLRAVGDWPVAIIGEAVEGAGKAIPWRDLGTPGRWAKVNLDTLSPFGQTLYLDADTRVHPRADLGAGFRALDAGWDLVIGPSERQGSDWLWHVPEEREITRDVAWPGLALQGGLFWFGRTPGAARFFEAWRTEWLGHKGQDQAALLRALHWATPRVWVFRQESLIAHRFGMAKARG